SHIMKCTHVIRSYPYIKLSSSNRHLSILSIASYQSFKGSIFSAAIQLLFNSSPPCTWNVEGGSFPCILVANTAFAFFPAPPATAAFSTFISSCCSSNKSISASNPSSSPAPVHQLKISTSPLFPLSPPSLALSFFSSDESELQAETTSKSAKIKIG